MKEKFKYQKPNLMDMTRSKHLYVRGAACSANGSGATNTCNAGTLAGEDCVANGNTPTTICAGFGNSPP